MSGYGGLQQCKEDTEQEGLDIGSVSAGAGDVCQVFLIDSENLPNYWVRALDTLTENDVVYVFYSDNSKPFSPFDVDLITQSRCLVKFIKVHLTGECNALDFQLVSELGFMLHSSNEGQYFIVSRDKGFDSVVEYWCNKGYDLRRVERLVEPDRVGKGEPNAAFVEFVHGITEFDVGTCMWLWDVFDSNRESDLANIYRDLLIQGGHDNGVQIYRMLKPAMETVRALV